MQDSSGLRGPRDRGLGVTRSVIGLKEARPRRHAMVGNDQILPKIASIRRKNESILLGFANRPFCGCQCWHNRFESLCGG